MEPPGGAALRWAVATMVTALAAMPAAGQLEPGQENRVVLRVNDRIVTLYEYQRAVAEQIRQIRNAPGLTDPRRQELLGEVGRAIMKTMFEEQLILSRADQLAVVIDESDVEQQIRATWERFGIETEEQFRDALAQSGMREEDYRERTRIELRANIVRGREVAPRIDLADEDLRRFYRDNEERFAIPERARFEEVVILEGVVPADRMAPLASLARTRLTAGTEATEVVEGLGEGATAVDVGWVTPGDLAAELDAVAWDLQPGDVADAVAARGGLHVLKMLEREPASVQPFEDVRKRSSARSAAVSSTRSTFSTWRSLRTPPTSSSACRKKRWDTGRSRRSRSIPTLSGCSVVSGPTRTSRTRPNPRPKRPASPTPASDRGFGAAPREVERLDSIVEQSGLK